MELYEAINNYLSSYANLKALVADRILVDEAQQNTAYPYIVHYSTGSSNEHGFRQDTGLVSEMVTIDCYGLTRDSVNSVAKQVKIALQNWTRAVMGGTGGVEVESVMFENAYDAFDDNTGDEKGNLGVKRRILEFEFWHQE